MGNLIDSLMVKTIILGLVNDVPETPKLNLPDPQQASDVGRVVSFKHELCITQQLAFICSYSSDPLHVLAVCIEEGVSGPGITIRFAANTGRHVGLLDGLKKIASILQQEAGKVNTSANEDDLLKEAVSLNRKRILGRFRSRHVLNRGKAPLLRRLNTAKQLLFKTMSRAEFKALETTYDHLQDQFDKLESMDQSQAHSCSSDQILYSLVKGVDSLLRRHEQDFQNIPETPGIWTGTATTSFIDRLRKVSQYVKACNELLRAARRYDIFSNIAVEFVDFQGRGSRLSGEDPTKTDQVITSILATKKMAKFVYGRKTSLSQVRQTVENRLNKPSRIHAEIQLILHYEEQAAAMRPRVICSSKSACYLCQLFINMDGRFYTPSTHGRLYDTWSWPSTSCLSETRESGQPKPLFQHLLPEFDKIIDRKLNQCLGRISNHRRDDPVESRVDVCAPITPSILSVVPPSVDSKHTNSAQSLIASRGTQSQVVSTDVGASPTIKGEKSVTSHRLPSESSSESMPLISTLSPTICQIAHGSENRKSSELTLSNISHQICQGKPPETLRLQIGEKVTCTLGLTAKLQIDVPGLHVYLEDQPTEGALTLRHSVYQQLPLEICCFASAGHEGNDETAHFVDVDEGHWVEQPTPEGVLFSPGGLLLKRGSTLLRLRAV